MPLFETIPVDHKHIYELVVKNWNLNLGKLLKASQNHTFQAFSLENQTKYAVRVTPDPKKIHLQRIKDQIAFVNYLVKGELKHQVSPIKTRNQAEKFVLIVGELIIVVFEWAWGSAINFMDFKWIKDKSLIFSWGRYFAQLHKISKKFQAQHPDIAKRIQRWDQVHQSILAGVELHSDDIPLIQNSEHYGVIHGDLNISNFHYVEDGDYLSVFDTDQVQRGFYLFDIAQAIFTLVMLEEGGVPIVRTPVEGCSHKAFQEIIVAGYESEGLKVDFARLHRMVQIKRQLYIRFADRAFKEGDVPKDMQAFLKYIKQTIGSKGAVKQSMN